jgi:chromosome segregation ATPase
MRSGRRAGSDTASSLSHSAAASTPIAVGTHLESELNAVRREIQSIHREVEREQEADAVQATVETEISSLYQELQRAAAKLESERTQRRRVETELEAIRMQKTRDTAALAQDMEAKRLELQSVREERAALKEWLDRGVQECRRVAAEVTVLKQALEESESKCTEHAQTKEKLTQEIQSLTAELHAVQRELEKTHHEKALLQLRSEETTGALKQAEAHRKVTQSEADRIAVEMVRMSQRVRGLEDAELCLQSLCACVGELTGEISALQAAVLAGNTETVFASPPNAGAAQSTRRLGEPRRLSDEIVEAKLLLQRMQDAVGKLRKAVKVFIAERKRQEVEMQRLQQDELAAVHREKELAVHKYNAEKEGLRRRVEDLEREILNVAAGEQRNTEAEANQRLEQLDRLLKANVDLKRENEELAAETAQLRAKVQKMKVDWSKVEVSRQRFFQLQTEVQLMHEYYEKISLENRNLKLLLESNGAAAASPSVPAPDGSLAAMSSSRGPGTPFSVVSKQAFEQWKLLNAKATEE